MPRFDLANMERKRGRFQTEIGNLLEKKDPAEPGLSI
jgi:hypothetical protein